MYCAKCGNLIKNGARFCGKCGSETIGNQNVPQTVMAVDNQTYPVRKKAPGGIILAIACILVLCVVITCGVLILRKNISSGNSNQTVNNAKEDKQNGMGETASKEIVVKNDEIVISPIYKKELAIDSIIENEKSIEKAEIVSFSGSLTQNNQIDTYKYTVPRDGRYRFFLSELQSGVNVYLDVYDERVSTPSIIRSIYKNGNGLTLRGLVAGDVYTVRITQEKGFSDYEIKIGQQKESCDISNYTLINDSVEFTDQRNVYNFTVPRDGRYRFEMAGMQSGTYVQLYAFNELGEVVVSNEYGCNNGKGITLKGLKAGEKYEIQVRQKEGFSDYQLKVGHQKETVDVSDLTMVKDSVEFTDQRNVYKFTVPMEGVYRFEMAGMHADTKVNLYVFNDLYETVGSHENSKNGDGVTLDNLVAGNTYEIQVIQNENYGNYELEIGRQKQMVSLFEGCTVHDSIEYHDQENIYQFIPDKNGTYVISLYDMQEGFNSKLSVLNHLDEIIDCVSKTENGSQLVLENVQAGQVYKIKNKWVSAYGEYTLKVEKTE